MRYPKLTAALVLCALSSLALAEENPIERGVMPDSTVQYLDVDHVDLFRGSLGITLPIGQQYRVNGGLDYSLALTYGSDAWDVRAQDNCPTCLEPDWQYVVTPGKNFNAGFGWALHLGKLKYENIAGNDKWTYTAPDSSEHGFFTTLHDGETADGALYSRDDTYMRLKVNSSVSVSIEMADGTTHWFYCYDTTNKLWRLSSIQDRFSNNLTVSYGTDGQQRPYWTFTDSLSRTHYVYFNKDHGQVEEVNLAAFNGQRAVYTFTYAFPQVRVPCLNAGHGYYNTPPVVPGAQGTLPFLVQVTLPDGSSYRMTDSGGPTYYRCCSYDGSDPCSAGGTAGSWMSPGVIRRLYLPTGGGIEWEIGLGTYEWDMPFQYGQSWEARPNYLYWATVTKRKLLDQAGSPLSGHTWEYSNQVNYTWSPSTRPYGTTCVGDRPEERRMVVKAPDGNSSVFYFRAYPGQGSCVDPEPKRSYGLGNTSRVPDPLGDNRYLSAQYFQGQVTFDGTGNAIGTLLREVYRAYKLDSLQDDGTFNGSRFGNRHLLSERTVHSSDGNRYATVTNSSFDGLGHFRTVTTDGNFGSGDVRISTTNFNPSSGTYPGSFAQWPFASPWVINTYTSSTVQEGTSVAKTESCFDAPTGYLLRTRTFKNAGTSADPSRSANDVLVAYTKDSLGRTTAESTYGGDTQTLNTTSPLCSVTLPSTTVYQINHTYANGGLATSRYASADGSGFGAYVVDQTVDLSTGLVSSSRTATGPGQTGLGVSHTYDTMNRRLLETPDQGACQSHVHHKWVSGTGDDNAARVENYTCKSGQCTSSGCTSGNILARSSTRFDGFGRAYLERSLLASGSWNQRYTRFDAMGRTTSVSEWIPYSPSGPIDSQANRTEYSNFDPFGRVGQVRAPDGSIATLSYTGVRQRTKTTTVNGQSSVTTETYDRQGRLVSVAEPSGTSGASITTTYKYDLGNRVKEVKINNTQTRTFTYDNRGFLNAETLPELGPGTKYYGTSSSAPYYDARGHVLKSFDGLHRLLYTYDRAERLVKVEEANASWAAVRTLRQFTYENSANGTGDWRLGKLVEARGYTATDGTAEVRENYSYGGLGGAVSLRATYVALSGATTPAFSQTFTTAFTWNQLGRLETVTYPSCPSCNNAPGRTVYNAYTNGYLTAVGPYYATGITYHANGMVADVTHGKWLRTVEAGVVDHYGINTTSYMRRPTRIWTDGAIIKTTGADGDWDSGTYTYDGVGNITAMGTDAFTYDKVSRLTGATLSGAGSHTYAYDPYANLTSYNGAARTTSTSTNRLTTANTVYDNAGNLTRWGSYYHVFDPLNKEVKYYSTVAPTFTLVNDYSAGGERTVIRNVVGTTATYTISIRDLGGKVLRDVEYNGTSWSWKKDYVYRDGLLLASQAKNEGYRHYHLDHLGSPRLVTDRTGERLALFRYWPYGQEVVSGNQDTSERMRFTGHERDLGAASSTADDLDYMHARHYGPILARFTSLDLVRGSARRPQSWNLFSYAGNNPIVAVDPFGLSAQKTTGPTPTPKPCDGSDQPCQAPTPPQSQETAEPPPQPTPTTPSPARQAAEKKWNLVVTATAQGAAGPVGAGGGLSGGAYVNPPTGEFGLVGEYDVLGGLTAGASVNIGFVPGSPENLKAEFGDLLCLDVNIPGTFVSLTGYFDQSLNFAGFFAGYGPGAGVAGGTSASGILPAPDSMRQALRELAPVSYRR